MKLRSFHMQSDVIVKASVERVWVTFADAARWPEWSPVCAEVRSDLARSWTAGARLGFKLRMAGRRVPFNVEIVESDPPRRVAWSSAKFTITAKRTFTFTSVTGGTRVTDRKEFSSTALPVGLWYPRRVIRTMTERWLLDLKTEAERTQ